MKSGNPIKPSVTLFWFRRDLRLEDNAGLYHALKSTHPVLPFFLFDRNILDLLENHTDRRVEFIYKTLPELPQTLRLRIMSPTQPRGMRRGRPRLQTGLRCHQMAEQRKRF